PRALLVRPVDEPHRHGRLALPGHATQYLHPGEDVEAAVEPAAVRNRVDVAADQQRALGGSGQREPLVPRRVDLLDRPRPGDLVAQPRTRALPRLRPRDPLRTVLVAREPAQLLELGDGAGRVERHLAGDPNRDGRRLAQDGERASCHRSDYFPPGVSLTVTGL